MRHLGSMDIAQGTSTQERMSIVLLPVYAVVLPLHTAPRGVSIASIASTVPPRWIQVPRSTVQEQEQEHGWHWPPCAVLDALDALYPYAQSVVVPLSRAGRYSRRYSVPGRGPMSLLDGTVALDQISNPGGIVLYLEVSRYLG